MFSTLAYINVWREDWTDVNSIRLSLTLVKRERERERERERGVFFLNSTKDDTPEKSNADG